MVDEQAKGSREVGVADAFSSASSHALTSSTRMMESVVEANRAMLAAFGGGSRATTATEAETSTETEAPTDEVVHTEAGWTLERSADTVEKLGVGETVSFTKRILEEDLQGFALASGDTNRLHFDEAYASETRFEGRIVHGTLVSGLISAALARLPGVTVYLSQDLEFLAPVRIGQTVTADCEIVEDLGDGRYRLATTVSNEDGETVIDGEAVVLIDDSP